MAIRSIKTRLDKLERQTPKASLFFILTDPCDDIPLTPEEDAILEAERLRLKELKNPILFMHWSRKEAQRLSSLAPNRNEDIQTTLKPDCSQKG